MNHLRLASMLGSLLLTLAAAADGGARPAPDLEASIRELTLARAGKRAADLPRDGQLAAVARAHSRNMHQHDRLAHDLQGRGPAERVARQHRRLFGLVSENVGVQKNWPSDAERAQRLVEGWMNSRGHRHNILAPYDHFEVGCFGDDRTTYCTQLFVRSAVRLSKDVPYRRAPGTPLSLTLAAADEGPERRISIAAAGAEAVDPGAPVVEGEVRLKLPNAPARYQLKLWTRQPGEALHYRIVDGPYLCAAGDAIAARVCDPD